MAFVHPSASRAAMGSSPRVPCLPIRTRDPEHYPELGPTTPPPIEVNDDIEFEISEILDSKIDKQRKCQLLYLVHWSGYEGTDQETDWLSALELTHAKELVQDFHTAYPHKPGPLNSLNT